MRIPFVFALFVCSLFCNAQNERINGKKVSPFLEQFSKSSNKPDSIDVVLSFKDAHPIDRWEKRTRLIARYLPSNIIVCKVKTGMLTELINDTTVIFADLHRKPKEELASADFDITLNKFNLVHRLYPSTKGSKIQVSLKEQRFDTTDIDLKGRYFNTGIAATALTGHASRMVTMLAGGGNTSPFTVGAAPGVRVTSSDFSNLLPDADSIYRQHHISVQNHSYGTDIENYYGADAAAFDASTYNDTSLIHVFSSGNVGTTTSTTGPYANVSQIANLTGSFKMAKNIITVGAVDSFNTIMELSSKGPAYDGRVKPDLVAFGQDGSSGSSALVSGAVALVQDAYLASRGSVPSAALTKAVLLSSADQDPAGVINYTTGYGNLNAYQALATITANHFIEDGVEKEQTKSYTLHIPANTARFKIMLVWTDTPAAANAAKALVNDLDAKLSFTSTRESWLPWVLNPSANLDSLQLPAVRKIDTLNNVELITVDHPKSGTYTFQVNGSKLITPVQRFAVAYHFDTIDHFMWTYPVVTDVLEAGKKQIIRWESNLQGDAVLEYALNSGPWQTIASGIPVQRAFAEWPAPDTSITAQLRLTIPDLNTVQVSEVFTISQITGMGVGFNCSDSFLLHWNHISDHGYQLYRLGDQYLEPVSLVADTFVVIQKSLSPSPHYAIAPQIGSKSGLKSYTIDYHTQGVGCYFQSFTASIVNINRANLEIGLGSTYGVQQLSFQKQKNNEFTDLYTNNRLVGSNYSFADTALTIGVNNYRVALTLANGSTIYSSLESVFYFPDEPVIVFPNPVRLHQPLRLIAKEPGVYSFSIFDINGKLIYKGQLSDINQDIMLQKFSRGTYLVKIFSRSVNFTKKIIVY